MLQMITLGVLSLLWLLALLGMSREKQQRGSTVTACEEQGSSTLWSVDVIWSDCTVEATDQTWQRKKVKGGAGPHSLLLLSHQTASFQSEVRGHWTVTVVQMPALKETVWASPCVVAKGILFIWQLTYPYSHSNSKHWLILTTCNSNSLISCLVNKT